MEKQARLVIIGAGIVGCSAAYHLTKMGWKDIVVLDQGKAPFYGGSSSHAFIRAVELWSSFFHSSNRIKKRAFYTFFSTGGRNSFLKKKSFWCAG